MSNLNNIDLDPESYSIDELINMYSLKQTFDVFDVENQYKIFINSDELKDSQEYLNFITETKNKLIHHIRNRTSNSETKKILMLINQVDNIKYINTNLTEIDELQQSIAISIDNMNIDATQKQKYKHLLNQKIYDIKKEYKTRNLGNTYTLENKNVDTPTISLDQKRYDILQKPQIIQNNSNFVIDRNYNTTQDIFLNKVPRDVLNPVRRQLITKILSIDSLFRSPSYLSNDYVYQIDTPIKNVVSMKISSVELPNVWYSFSEVNKSNIFTIKLYNVNDGSGNFFDAEYDIIIPPGNYTVNAFLGAINNYITNNAVTMPGLDFIIVNVNNARGNVVIRANHYTDSNSNPLPYYNSGSNVYYSPNFYFELLFNYSTFKKTCLYKNAGWMLGFHKESYTVTKTDTYIDTINGNGLVTYEGYLESDSYYGSGIFTYGFIEIDDYNKNYHNHIITNNNHVPIGDNILGRLSLTSGSNTVVIDTPQDKIFKTREYFGPVTLDKLRIRLVDKHGDPIDINNSNYSLSLELQILYS